MVAGEVRTIELCTEPAQIIGRLRLLRRLAYAKLRGYDWPLIRKMYSAIVTSIEAGENTWDSSFDRFESILYRRYTQHTRAIQGQPKERDREPKKWFCREFNRPEGCTRTSPHRGQGGLTKMVIHMCAACWMKERMRGNTQRGMSPAHTGIDYLARGTTPIQATK